MQEQLVTKLPETISAPVLLIAFNRPEVTLRTFNAIRNARPLKFYFAVDGPRPERPDDLQNRKAVMDIVNRVDWECEVHTLFREENVGCGLGPYSAISWVLEHEDRVIILEDDCVASLSFFRFCEDMLERYKDDTRIWNISGRSHQAGSKYFDHQDYIFATYAHTWGWATWKRCWEQMDMMMSDVPEFLAMGGYKNTMFSEKYARMANERLLKKYHSIQKEITHSWDSQWGYAKGKNGGLGIVPCKNLIQNIGFGEDATHTSNMSSSLRMVAEELPETIRHPRFVLKNKGYEELHFMNHVKKIHGYHTPAEKLLRRIKGRLKRLFGK